MPSPTPAHVVTAIQTVARYLVEEHYGSIIIAPTGGASFHLRNVLDEKEDLFKALEAEHVARTRAEEALRLIRAYTGDRYVTACVEEGLGGVNG